MPAVKKALKKDPVFKAAWSRLIYLWSRARESECYIKKEWIELQQRLNASENIEAVMWDAEYLYEACQSEDWPLQFD